MTPVPSFRSRKKSLQKRPADLVDRRPDLPQRSPEHGWREQYEEDQRRVPQRCDRLWLRPGLRRDWAVRYRKIGKPGGSVRDGLQWMTGFDLGNRRPDVTFLPRDVIGLDGCSIQMRRVDRSTW